MKNKYFDKEEFQQILTLTKNNPYKAKYRFEEYLTKYPEDYSTYPYYISNLISLQKIEEAEEVLNYLSNAFIDNKKFNRNKEKLERLKRYIIINKIKILSFKEQYQEVHQLYLENKELIDSIHIGNVIFYCENKLSPHNKEYRNDNSYLFRQIIEYQEEDFLDHIKKHAYSDNEETTTETISTFSKDFPLNKVLNEIKKHIPSSTNMFYGFYSNIYTFKYDKCGICNGQQTNYFKVVCFNKTDNIITMFPSIEGANLPCIDLNYLLEENINKFTNIKRLSQIDKFNQRYKNNNK